MDFNKNPCIEFLSELKTLQIREIHFRDATISQYRAEYGIKNPSFSMPASKHINRDDIRIGQGLPQVTRLNENISMFETNKMYDIIHRNILSTFVR